MVNTYFHTMAFSPLLYLALPLSVMIFTPEVLGGTGIRTSIFCAVRAVLNKDLRTSWRKRRGRKKAREREEEGEERETEREGGREGGGE